jgi:hypothetical protein
MKKISTIKYYITGAGYLIIGKSPRNFTGNAVGFSFGVSWGKYGETGGVIDWKEALKLAIRIIITLPRVILTIQRKNKQYKKIY